MTFTPMQDIRQAMWQSDMDWMKAELDKMHQQEGA